MVPRADPLARETRARDRDPWAQRAHATVDGPARPGYRFLQHDFFRAARCGHADRRRLDLRAHGRRAVAAGRTGNAVARARAGAARSRRVSDASGANVSVTLAPGGALPPRSFGL